MKIQIDTKEKTLAVEENVNLDEFMKAVRKLFPNNEWKKYELKTQTIVNWTNPIIYERYPWRPYPWYEITYDSTGSAIETQIDNAVAEIELSTNVYNVEIN